MSRPPRSKTGLEVGPRLPRGSIPKPPPPGGREPALQVLPLPPPGPCCPYCKSPRVKRTSARGRIRYYRCCTCADPETGDWSRFRVIRR